MRRARGFSLIELIVSLAVLGLVSLLLVSSVQAGRRVWERMDARGADIAGIEAAQDIIRDRLEHIVPLTRYDGEAPYADMEGKADRLFFIAPASPAASPTALADHRLSLSTGSELVLSSTSDVAREVKPPREDRVLLRNVAKVEFFYFGAHPPGKDRRWRDYWYQRPAPPELIRVRVTFRPGDPRVWPDLLVHPAVTQDTQCILNIQRGLCKGR